MSKEVHSRNKLYELGAAYYPDYIPREILTRTSDGDIRMLSTNERIAEDFKRMENQGLHTIRMGEFSWSSVEPKRGEFTFERFHLALKLAEKHGINVIFCTPTATPPKWLIDEYPDILPITRNNVQIPFGSRRHYDFAHPAFQQESKRISEVYAKEFGKSLAITGWQTDNEFGCHNSIFLFTKHMKNAFHGWLKQKYGKDLMSLNENWFTWFWSQGYTEISQIDLPFASWADQNPHLELDFRRFANELMAKFQKDQVQLIKKYSPGRFITHNLMTLFFDLCPWVASEDLDVVGFDHYQMERDPHPVSSAWQFGLMRSLKKQEKFLILEQQPVQVNWQPVNRRFTFDWLFLWAAQSAFQGAKGMYDFSWQRMYGGGEQYHDGVVPHDVRIPKSSQEKVIEAKNEFFNKVAADFSLDVLPDTRKDVLCIFNSESLWSHEITSQSVHYHTRKEIDAVSQLCVWGGLGLHFAPSLEAAKAQLSEFACLVLPGYAFEFSENERHVLRDFVSRGGKVVSFPRTAMKKLNNQMSPLPLFLYHRDDFYLDDYGALLDIESDTFGACEKETKTKFSGLRWSEKIVVQNSTWQPLALFESGHYAGFPAVIQNKSFKSGGIHTHFATCPEITLEFTRWFWKSVGMESTVVDLKEGARELQFFPLVLADRRFMGVVNFGFTDEICRIKSHHFVHSKMITAGIDGECFLEMTTSNRAAQGNHIKLDLPARRMLLLEFQS